jgi:putative oxidoreductase
MKNPAYRIGTLLYALVIGFFGANHFMNAKAMTSAVPSYFPGGIIWVYITGGALILAAIAILINYQSKLAGYLLMLLLLIFVGTIHVPAFMNAANEGAKAMAMGGLLKDVGLAAGALMIAGYGR